MDLARRLRSRGHRVTPQREAVLEVLRENEGVPLDPEAVYEFVGARHPGIGLATVYRTLELFRDLGIVTRVHLHEGSRHYELNTGGHHHHMVCVSCGSVDEFDGCVVDDLEESIREDSDFVVTSHCLSLFGYCPACQPGRLMNRSPYPA
ncbi:MAG: transcriptional repressor [Actinomycetia bacterium]|nr:transcriptional repressor [Actinomycetota bacterium]MCG2796345.1 transcriptional repressor [Actinomycetes bacterium]